MAPPLDTGHPRLLTIRVRMYQVGFGDAFLLSFEYDGQLEDGRDRRHVLIDFGSTSAPKSPRKLDKIAEAIRDHTTSELPVRRETRGEIDVVVVSHRHKDHLSAFASPAIANLICGPGYPKLVVRSWTEDPAAAKDARSPAPSGAGGGAAIASQSIALVASLDQAYEFATGVAGKLKRIDPRSRSLAAELKQFAEDQLKNAGAVRQLEAWAAAGKPTYLHYGLHSGIEEFVPGIRVRVLGPPTVDQYPDVATQRQTDPNEFWMIYKGAIDRLRSDYLLTGAKLSTEAKVTDPAAQPEDDEGD